PADHEEFGQTDQGESGQTDHRGGLHGLRRDHHVRDSGRAAAVWRRSPRLRGRTRGRTLILPLPRMDGVQLDSARAWFTLEAQGMALAARMPQLARLLASDAPDDHATVLDLYLALRAEVNPSWDRASACAVSSTPSSCRHSSRCTSGLPV